MLSFCAIILLISPRYLYWRMCRHVYFSWAIFAAVCSSLSHLSVTQKHTFYHLLQVSVEIVTPPSFPHPPPPPSLTDKFVHPFRNIQVSLAFHASPVSFKNCNYLNGFRSGAKCTPKGERKKVEKKRGAASKLLNGNWKCMHVHAALLWALQQRERESRVILEYLTKCR